jgi:hypothetical protein
MIGDATPKPVPLSFSQVERLLRDAGLSDRAVSRFMAAGYDAASLDLDSFRGSQRDRALVQIRAAIRPLQWGLARATLAVALRELGPRPRDGVRP